ncbi:MAG: aminotransferase, partial [Pseudomonadales bacterium]
MSRQANTSKLQEMDKSNHFHPFTDLTEYAHKGGRVVSQAEHIYIRDSDGNQILDGMSGLWCCNLGYSQPKIVDAVHEQLQKLPYYNSFFNCSNDRAIELSAALVDAMPEQFNRIFFTNSGSEANDTNIRFVHRYYDLLGKPEKKLVISRKNAYHGSTIAAASLGGMSSMHKQYTGLSYVHHIEQPHWFNEGGDMSRDEFGLQVAQLLEAKIDELGQDKVAAFIAEPIQGAGGVVIPPDTYWPAIQKICNERDILFISDEVICGFGRTGNWFGCDTYGTKPDLMTFAKAVTNGFQPLGGVAIGDKVADVLTSGGGEFAHGFTYSGHPAACAAGIATLDILHSENIIDRVATQIGPYFARRFDSLADHPIVGEVRTKGMLAAIELVKDKSSHERLAPDSEGAGVCRDAAVRNGLMVRAVGDAMISAPPLICNEEEVDLIV